MRFKQMDMDFPFFKKTEHLAHSFPCYERIATAVVLQPVLK